MLSGLNPIYADGRDYSIVPTFGAIATTEGLPDSFSIYDGRPIPDQNASDVRFTPSLQPIPEGCTGEGMTFAGGLEDSALYNPLAFYLATPPNIFGTGRDIRDALSTAINIGYQNPQGQVGNRRTAYFNCYGAGAIDDFDAARIGVYINQNEKRGVIVGSWWYPDFENPQNGIISTSSYNTSNATLHCWLITGWKTINGALYLEGISWQGMDYGLNGLHYVSRETFNALMAQPYTGAFTLTKMMGQTTIPIGFQAYIDQVVYYVRQLFQV